MTFLWVLIAWITVQSAVVENKMNLPANSIDTSVNELAHGYLQWMKHHPGSVPAGKPLKLEMPTVDLYSPEGVSLYYGADSTKNAAFLRTLPQGIKNAGGAAKTGVPRPSLKEAIEMFPEFKERETGLLSDNRFTIFAVTYPNWDLCREQNEAIEKLRGRVAPSKLRIIEVRLHK
jgi:hypothetical protein